MFKLRKHPVWMIGALVGMLGFAVPVASAGDKVSVRKTFRIQKASDLIGKPVMNKSGERLGEIQDLAIDGERGRVAYAVLSFGTFLNMGGKWFAVPTGALTLPNHAEHFVLAVETDQLKNAPGFDKNQWPRMQDVKWSTDTHKFYGQRPYWMDEKDASTPTTMNVQKASDIIGRSVRNNQGEDLGEIQDLVVDPDTFRVAYAVLTFGGYLGFGDKLFAMPVSVLEMPDSDGDAVLNVDKNRLESAKGFDQNDWPNLADPTIAVTTYELYGKRPYWLEDTHPDHKRVKP